MRSVRNIVITFIFKNVVLKKLKINIRTYPIVLVFELCVCFRIRLIRELILKNYFSMLFIIYNKTYINCYVFVLLV